MAFLLIETARLTFLQFWTRGPRLTASIRYLGKFTALLDRDGLAVAGRFPNRDPATGPFGNFGTLLDVLGDRYCSTLSRYTVAIVPIPRASLLRAFVHKLCYSDGGAEVVV